MSQTAEQIMETDESSSMSELSQIMEQVQDNAMTYLPTTLVEVQSGFNPRRFFDANAMQELANDIQNRGVVQPLVVRPKPDKKGFWLIAGERRLRACRSIGIEQIPCLIRVVDDSEAAAMATSENTVREQMSFAEESRVAYRIVSQCDGSKEEAAQLLGWSLTKLESRLALLRCTSVVLDALEERQINVGHAELLAGLTDELQAETLPGIIEKKVPVAELKNSLSRYAYKLSEAKFCTKACQGCVHNSSSLLDLFDAHLTEGHCQNRDCYEQKTKDWLGAQKAELGDQYAVVYLDVEKTPDSYRFLVREGQGGVGREQFNACQGCAKFGAVISTQKGSEGKVSEGVCFDLSCNNKKQKAYAESLQSTPVTETKAGQAVAAGSTKSKSSGNKKKAAQSNAIPNKVAEFHNVVYLSAAAKMPEINPHLTQILALRGLLDRLGAHANEGLKKALTEYGVSSKSYDKPNQLKTLFVLDDEKIEHLMLLAAQSELARADDVDSAKVTLTAMDIDLSKHFVLDKAYLETQTVSGIEGLLTESGFDKWMDETKGKDAYKGFLKGKKRGDLIQSVVDSDFDFKGFVPANMKLTGEKSSK